MSLPRWIILVVGLVLIGVGVNGLVEGEGQAAFALVFGLIASGLYLHSRYSERRRLEFIQWLATNADQVRQGGATYRDAHITPTTVVRHFGIAMSAMVVSFRTYSRYLVDGHDAVALTGVVATVSSLLLGWWGIPWGPIYTLQVTYRNLRGGQRQTVGELLDQLAAANRAAA